MADNSGASNIISLPKGGGALSGIGEKFSPDLHTGTGNFSVPVAVPPGRGGLQPDLTLVYSSGNGNGPFGLGWMLNVPCISRKTSRGIPRYDDAKDVFILSGAEDLVPVEVRPGITRYRPRTEGLFAEILHYRDPDNDYWQVRTAAGMKSLYGTEHSLGTDAAAVYHPTDRTRIFEWRLTRTEDSFGNCIEYEYERDSDQLYLKRIRYADCDVAGAKMFLVSINFEYADRTPCDAFSRYRSGFEIRTRRRCSRILTRTHAGEDRDVRSLELLYVDQRADATILPINHVSLLSQVQVVGLDSGRSERLAPLEFRYSRFEPERRDFSILEAKDWPTGSLTDPNLALVDLFGNGLPSLLQLDGQARYWRNLGNGRFDRPQLMPDAPAHLALADAGVQLLDATGNGRADLLVTSPAMSGYFPLSFSGEWERRSFRRFERAPSFDLEDPEVKLVDLDGDGVTDAIRSDMRLECFFNHPEQGWHATRRVERQALEVFPNVNFSDARVKWGDFTGDDLQSIALIHDGSVEYWPNLGYGSWGKRVRMERAPRFPYGYDPRRILVGDVDGDGLADLVYVEQDKVTLWINQSGNRWSDPIIITGTPPVSSLDDVRLADMLGSGIEGVLWSRDVRERDRMCFLDFTGGRKPYLLQELDNHIGAVTRVEYAPSTRYYVEDETRRETRWRTNLPFPVQVVARVEVIEYFSRGKLTTNYKYHDGYWDGAEREFRGFGLVEQFDSEFFETYNGAGLHDPETVFAAVDRTYFSPPMRTCTWFHLGPVGDEGSEWVELDRSEQYWTGDPQQLAHTQAVNAFLSAVPPSPVARRIRRDALRSLRGSVLRSETYALDGSEREGQPFTVIESAYGLVEVEPPVAADAERPRVFFPHPTWQRTTRWERGVDPMTQVVHLRYTEEDGVFDRFGRVLSQTQIACPRGWRDFADRPGEAYLTTRTRTEYAVPIDGDVYIHDRVARATMHEVYGTAFKTVAELASLSDNSADIKAIGQTLSFYDGPAFVGLPLGQVGLHGERTRGENLVLTLEILRKAYDGPLPPFLQAEGAPVWGAEYPAEFRTLLPAIGGYLFRAGGSSALDVEGYFVVSSRLRYDFQSGVARSRGLVLESLDPLHDADVDSSAHRTLVEYERYQILPQKLTDAVGLITEAEYDYRLLQPREVTDANGNRSSFAFSPLGLLTDSFVRGKTDEEGDGPHPSCHREYDFLAFDKSPPATRQPIFVRTIRRVHHDSELDVAQPARDETITVIEYTDGRGRLLQCRAQAEDVRFGDEHFGGGASILPGAPGEGIGGDVIGRRNADGALPNVVVTGARVYDNKGRVVEQYEPWFSSGWSYASPDVSDFGEKSTSFYDPAGRVVRVVNADGSEQRSVYGVPGSVDIPDLSDPDIFEPTPWESYSYDTNDNAGRTHADIARTYRHSWNTPASNRVDALGRVILTIARNREPSANAAEPLGLITEVSARATYDIRGNVLTRTDALGRVAFSYVYDLANRCLRYDSIDSGSRTNVPDASGSTIEQRDSKGSLMLQSFDRVNRVIRVWARDWNGSRLTLRRRIEYGDAGDAAQPPAERAANRATNRLGRMTQHLDEAGVVEIVAYDFKGNQLEKTRRVIGDMAILASFEDAPPTGEIAPFIVDWTNVASVPLDPDVYSCSMSYDALRRVKVAIAPRDVEGVRRRLKPHYNRGGALESMILEKDAGGGVVASDIFVEHIAYNAKGQRVFVAYGNGVLNRYTHDSHTFRLVRLRSERYEKPSTISYRLRGQPIQDCTYAYDLSGNILTLSTRTPGCGIIDSLLGRDALDRVFAYDALYQLRSASGRECDRPPDDPWDDSPRSTDLNRVRPYTETYNYDVVGNLSAIAHASDGVTSNRAMALAAGTNQLQSVTHGAVIFTYQHDVSGNMIAETTSRHFDWDYSNRLQVFRIQTAGSEPTVYSRSFHDASGRLIKKLIRKPGGIVEVTVDVDGIFERRRITRPGGVEQNDTLYVLDGSSRMAQVRVGNPFANDATPAVKFVLGDHLDSSEVVLDGAGVLINSEEYTPFGETSFGSFRHKRYRFGGQKRDDASGLYAFGARHYAPWLARWASADPGGPVDGANLFTYARNNPLNRADPSGTDSDPSDYRDAGAGPTDVSGAGAQQANAPTSTQDTISPSAEPPSASVWSLPDAKATGVVGAVVTPMIRGAPLGAPPPAFDPATSGVSFNTGGGLSTSGGWNTAGASGGSPLSAPSVAGTTEGAIAPGAATTEAIAPGASGAAEAIAPGAAGTTEGASAPGAVGAAEELGLPGLEVVAPIVAVPAVILGAGALFPGDAPLKPAPTSAELDAAFVRISREQNRRLEDAVRNWDFSLIAGYQPGRMNAIMKFYQSAPWISFSLLHMAYGKTLELMINDALQFDDVTGGHFEHLGGSSQADWRRDDGVLYDVCTTDTVAEHTCRSYGEKMRIYQHRGLPQFYP